MLRPYLKNGTPKGRGFHVLHPRTKERLGWVCKREGVNMWQICTPVPEGVSLEDASPTLFPQSDPGGYPRPMDAGYALMELLGIEED